MDDERISSLRALAHPVRIRITSLLTGNPMSAAEVARELQITHANASYHLRRLLEAGELVDAGEEEIRGGIAKRYRYRDVGPGAEPRRAASPAERAAYLASVHREVEHRVASGTRERMLSFDLDGWVDPEVWTEAVGLLERVSTMLHEANRAPRTTGTLHVSVTGTAFRMRRDR